MPNLFWNALKTMDSIWILFFFSFVFNSTSLSSSNFESFGHMTMGRHRVPKCFSNWVITNLKCPVVLVSPSAFLNWSFYDEDWWHPSRSQGFVLARFHCCRLHRNTAQLKFVTIERKEKKSSKKYQRKHFHFSWFSVLWTNIVRFRLKCCNKNHNFTTRYTSSHMNT